MKYRIAHQQTKRLIIGSAAGLLVAGIGLLTMTLSGAATFSTPTEAEDGTVTNASIVDDADASDSKAVRFNEPTTPPANPGVPAGVLNLTNWKLTLPVNTSHAGSPDEIVQPELATFVLDPYFKVASTNNAVVFRANAGGATTSGSGYPRSELREMSSNGSALASWSDTSGTHTMTIKEAITHLPDVKKHVVAGQIHDAADDVVMVRLEGPKLFLEGEGVDLGTLDANYTLGTIFTVKIIASGGHIKAYYNDVLKVDYARSGSGFYFKAGCYTQSNLSKGDTADAYGEVVIYDLQVSHT